MGHVIAVSGKGGVGKTTLRNSLSIECKVWDSLFIVDAGDLFLT